MYLVGLGAIILVIMKGSFEMTQQEQYLYKIVNTTLAFAGVELSEEDKQDLIMLELNNVEAVKNFDDKKQIAIIWSIEDVKSLDDTLTDDQAFMVLQAFELNHDGSMLAMWEDLQLSLDECVRELQS